MIEHHMEPAQVLGNFFKKTNMSLLGRNLLNFRSIIMYLILKKIQDIDLLYRNFLVTGEESDDYEKVYFEGHFILLHVFIILKCTLLWVQKSNNYYCVIVWPTEVFTICGLNKKSINYFRISYKSKK